MNKKVMVYSYAINLHPRCTLPLHAKTCHCLLEKALLNEWDKSTHSSLSITTDKLRFWPKSSRPIKLAYSFVALSYFQRQSPLILFIFKILQTNQILLFVCHLSHIFKGKLLLITHI